MALQRRDCRRGVQVIPGGPFFAIAKGGEF